ncbi:DUF3147 family protein [Bacillus sp. PK3_68]|uniref:DUF3147 family protein n=1 Tax=Bacillus sp. PK3_68 TaxID=2027408 RepID=UPI000E7447FE|nr:DUF3147 family protein [Bacillus sp. PK3_68]RJS50247.1 hypothetical protein CJ483_23750 [Bacillus sp. PK3_68]
MSFLVKVSVSACIIGLVTILAKYSPKYGGIVAALPLVSLLSLFWLYIQGEQSNNLSQFLFGVLYGLPSTIILVFIVAVALKYSTPFSISIILGISGWGLCLFLQKFLLSNMYS